MTETLEIVIDDLPEKPITCQICKINLAKTKFNGMYLCKYCYEDFHRCGD